MDYKLVLVIIVGVVIALLPLLVNIVDNIYLSQLAKVKETVTTVGTTPTTPYTITATSVSSTSVTTTTRSTAIPTYTVVENEAVSHRGADTLIVRPAKVVAASGAVIPITITVHFKHPQPCPYASWKVELYPSGGIQVISKSGSLIDPFDYVMKVKVKVTSSGELKVVYRYGSGCPYGSEEVVTVVIEVR